jgi:toxin FitB
MLLILDTNVISELMKSEAEPSVLAWFMQHTHDQFATTAICQAEVLGGLAALPDGKRKRSMLAAAQAIWEIDLERRVFAFDTRCAEAFADILRRRKKAARPIQFVDAAIAAICAANQASIVTRDTAGFEACGIKVINPWVD